MKIHTLLKLIAIALAFAILDVACSDCSKEDRKQRSMKISRYAVEMHKLLPGPTRSQSPFINQWGDLLAAEDTVKYNDLGIFLSPVVRVTATQSRAGFFNSAVACDPAPPKPTQQLEYITISSTTDLITDSKLYPEGSDLSPLMGVIRNGVVIPLEEFLRGNEDADYDGIILTFMQAPTHSQLQEFIIKTKLTNSVEFSARTHPIIIQP
jgi:hypothetical protein